MENIILIGHGSPKKDANNIDIIGRLLHGALHPGCSGDCVKVAYLQFAEPDLPAAIKDCARNGAERIIIHPYFLSNGVHVTKDIPEMLREAKVLYPDREFLYTEPLGIHEKLVQVVRERIYSARGLGPQEIEKRSLQIIAGDDDFSAVPSEQLPIVKRVIHATGDFEFKSTLVFHPDAVKRGIAAIQAGRDIITDVEMVKAGINKRLLARWGGRVICRIPDTDDQQEEGEGKTRAESGIERALEEGHNAGIVAIGNAIIVEAVVGCLI